MNKTNFYFYWLLLSYYPTISNKLILWNFNLLSTLIRYKFELLFILTHLSFSRIRISNHRTPKLYKNLKGEKKFHFIIVVTNKQKEARNPLTFHSITPSRKISISLDLSWFTSGLRIDRSIDRSVFGTVKRSFPRARGRWNGSPAIPPVHVARMYVHLPNSRVLYLAVTFAAYFILRWLMFNSAEHRGSAARIRTRGEDRRMREDWA